MKLRYIVGLLAGVLLLAVTIGIASGIIEYNTVYTNAGTGNTYSCRDDMLLVGDAGTVRCRTLAYAVGIQFGGIAALAGGLAVLIVARLRVKNS